MFYFFLVPGTRSLVFVFNDIELDVLLFSCIFYVILLY